MTFTDDVIRGLDAIALTKQREGRVPGLAAAVSRNGTLEWFAGIGSADLERPEEAPDPDTQYPIASNTKTFTAVCIMLLRDEGRLSLDDRIDAHLPVSSNGDVTVRQLLSHSSGMQREPVGDTWDTLAFPDRGALLENWDAAERVLQPNFKWHYSNLCFAMLGEIVARLDEREWMESVQARLLDPLGMTRTTLGLSGRAAGAYYLPPFTDVPKIEPALDCGSIAPAGGLCSTVDDLVRWGAFVADPEPLLARSTLEEMCSVQLLADVPAWTMGHGLGFQLIRRGERTWVGHTGGWPGSITGLYTHRDSGTSAMILMNNSVPEEFADLLGVWYSEGSPFVFSVRQGELEVKAQAATAQVPASRFEKVSDGVYRTIAGRERGELLRVHRDDQGRPVKLHWATYLCTREPLSFADEIAFD